MRAVGIKDADMAARLGITRQAVVAYRHGKRIPAPDVMRRIVQATGGAVQPNDFYEITAAAPTIQQTEGGDA